jgi:hypothetical protein
MILLQDTVGTLPRTTLTLYPEYTDTLILLQDTVGTLPRTLLASLVEASLATGNTRLRPYKHYTDYTNITRTL